MFTYPSELVPLITGDWPKKTPVQPGFATDLPDEGTIGVVLEVAYHASFLTEESRRLAFRLIYLRREEFHRMEKVREKVNASKFTAIVFPATVPFSVGELLRLAPATDFTKMLICVESSSSSELHIWGLLDQGVSWWKFVAGESHGGYPPPDGLAISCVEPGNITISRGGNILFSLRRGQISRPADDALYRGPIAKTFSTAAQQLKREALTRLKKQKWSNDSDSSADDYPRLIYIRAIERLLFTVRRRAHGGTVLIVPDNLDATDPRLLNRLNIKYSASHDEIWSLLANSVVLHDQYYKLFFELWDGHAEISKQDLRSSTDWKIDIKLRMRKFSVRFNL
ncbi:MAG TPA: hypothetical protein VF541_17790 [Longimicrobium sp.]|jgi:hypothetical protein